MAKSTSSITSTVHRRSVFDRIGKINKDDWNEVAADRNIYLSLDYLEALESAMKDSIDFFYVISYDENDQPVLVSAFQLVLFEDKRRKYSSHLGKLSCHLKNKILNPFTINVMVCGNVFSDGENGFLWKQITSTEAINEVALIAEELKEDQRIKEKSSITLFKEFWPSSLAHTDNLKEKSYRGFMIDVNMVLKIHESWKTMEDYLFSMKTKFRTRSKSVYRKSSEIVIRELSSDEIESHSDQINLLFGNVLEKSEFSFGRLTAEAFVNFKKNLGGRFCLKGFFLNDEMVGFSTSFTNNGVLEANYVGLDYQFNSDLSVYQRILYDYVEQSLKSKVGELHLGRTAEVVKSSIGAIPINMKLYARHRKSVPNLLLKPIIQSIAPSEFELRKPFKSNFKN
ncbi:MAG: hypothetical protein ACI865_003253 [Flavobacteriaceae bacterium]|jgi:hypothetical protein